MIIRPARTDDLNHLYTLAEKAGTGFTTLPRDKEKLAAQIEDSEKSFAGQNNAAGYYWLVMTDDNDSTLYGCTAIATGVGLKRPFFHYQLENHVHTYAPLDVRSEYQTLHLSNSLTGTTELCTLFLSPNHRGGKRGLILSFVRFLLIAAHSSIFADTIIAEMRGVTTENGETPFWEALGRHFFHIDFEEADLYSCLDAHHEMIQQLMPRQPIYLNILPKSAQSVIGKTQTATTPAVKLLEKAGLKYQQKVDIFDAGPILEGARDALMPIQSSKKMTLEITDTQHAEKRLIANTAFSGFRATYKTVTMIEKDGELICQTDAETAALLGVASGDEIICLEL